MKTLKEIGLSTKGHSKTQNMELEDYLPIYDNLWTSLRNDKIKLLEIGIDEGGSLRIWKEYFPNGEIVGADIESHKLFTEDRIQTVVVNQENIESLKNLGLLGPFDIIIDDGGHTMSQQINSLITLFDYVKPGGYYIVEDLCTSYWPHFGGSYPVNNTTTMCLLKYLCDAVNSIYIGYDNYGSPKNSRTIPNFPIENIESISFHQGVVVLKKSITSKNRKNHWLIPEYMKTPYVNFVEQALNNENVFSTFRSSNYYNNIVGHAVPELELEILYGELIKNNKIMSKFDIVKRMDKVGSPTISDKFLTAPINIRYMSAARRIMENFSNIHNVVEIGVGYGGLCFIMAQYFDLTGYKLIDIDCVVELSKRFLSKLPPVNDNMDSFLNSPPPYDLCISECAISELDDQTIQNYYAQYLSKSKHLFIRTNFESQSRKYQLGDFIGMLEKDFTVELTQYYIHESQQNTVVLGWNKTL